MAAPRKLIDKDVQQIRRRVRKGEQQTDLATEFGVNRKTIRRRLDALERAETEHAERIAEKRLRRQAAREKQKLRERERRAGVLPPSEHRKSIRPVARKPTRDVDASEWLDKRKNLSGRALAEAAGLVRVRNSDGTMRIWVERPEVDALLEGGWLLDD